MDDKTLTQLQKELKLHAHAIGIPEGAAEAFLKETLKSVQKSLSHKKTITADDLKRITIKELKKYNSDLAYAYQNYDKII